MKEEETSTRAVSSTRSTRLVFLPTCQVSLRPKSGVSMSARKERERGGHAPSMSSFLRVPSQAAHPTQRPEGTKHSRRVWLRHSQPISLSGQVPQKLKNFDRGSRRSGVDPTRGREMHRSRSERRSRSRRWFAQNFWDPRDAGGRVVRREHERVRRRMTGRSPKTGQDLATLSRATEVPSHLETDMKVVLDESVFYHSCWIDLCPGGVIINRENGEPFLASRQTFSRRSRSSTLLASGITPSFSPTFTSVSGI